MTVAITVQWLRDRRAALIGEKTRIQQNRADELASVNAQVAAIDDVLTAMSGTTATALDNIFAALANAGLRMEVTDRKP